MTVAAIGRMIGTILGFQAYHIMGMIAGVGLANFVVLTIVWFSMVKLKLWDVKLDLFSLTVIITLTILLVLTL